MKNHVLTFFGRLEKEKGSEYLIKTAQQILGKKISATLIIFGEGSQKNKIIQFAENLESFDQKKILSFKIKPNKVYYFGKRDLNKVIIPFLKQKTTFSLMPSLMLETLGLSALESIKAGVSIIGYKQGALNELIQNQHDLRKYDLQQILSSKETKSTIKFQIETKESWLKKIQETIPINTKKIALLNDYFQQIGGTEKHLHQITKLLQENNYQVKILTNPKTVKSELADFNPEVIWVHNFLRKLKPKTLKIVNEFKAYKIYTIHDLGLFTTFPSKLNNQELLLESNSFFDFYKTKTATLSLAVLKWFILIKPAITELQKFDTIIVLHKFYLKSAKKYIKKDPIILAHYIE